MRKIMRSHYQDEDGKETFARYYAQAKDELLYDASPWGKGPTETDICNRAAELAMADNEASNSDYLKELHLASKDLDGPWGSKASEDILIQTARNAKLMNKQKAINLPNPGSRIGGNSVAFFSAAVDNKAVWKKIANEFFTSKVNQIF
jgi:hypothetical protein